jgi:hypothetical protein
MMREAVSAMMHGSVSNIVQSVLPGALPATAANVALAVVAGAPAWLTALGQALIVAMWCSSAMRRQSKELREKQREITEKMTTLEAAILGLECVRAQRAAQLIGIVAGSICPTPAPGFHPRKE